MYSSYYLYTKCHLDWFFCLWIVCTLWWLTRPQLLPPACRAGMGRSVCSLCTRGWKYVTALAILHSHRELSIKVRSLLWQAMMTASWKHSSGFLHAKYTTAIHLATLHAKSIHPHNITFNLEAADVWGCDKEKKIKAWNINFVIFFTILLLKLNVTGNRIG